MAEGLPHINHCDNASELPAEIRFSKTKTTEIDDTKRRMWVYIYDEHNRIPK